jgi:DnaJ-class molecular chaperone
MEELMDDPFSKVPNGTEWCPECNGYGSSLFEETERCTRCGGTGLVMVAANAARIPTGTSRVRSDTRSRADADRGGLGLALGRCLAASQEGGIVPG